MEITGRGVGWGEQRTVRKRCREGQGGGKKEKGREEGREGVYRGAAGLLAVSCWDPGKSSETLL